MIAGMIAETTTETMVGTIAETIAGTTATVRMATMAVTERTAEMTNTVMATMATAPKNKKVSAMGWIVDKKTLATVDALIPTIPVTFKKAARLTAKDSAEAMFKATVRMATMADGN